jgi:hypothetical protein
MGTDLTERNWKYFSDRHLRDWHGVWTRYSPDTTVAESFRSLRQFRSNPERTQVIQTNRYLYDDRDARGESWEYSQTVNSLADGLFHPSRASMRGLFFETGACVWRVTQFDPDLYFGLELFFVRDYLRHSIGIVYEPGGQLMRTASIREDARGVPSLYWSPEIEQLPEQPPNMDWTGTAETIDRHLDVTQETESSPMWGWAGHKIFNFPDDISLSCPASIQLGTPFAIAANWLLETPQLQQLTVDYDDLGRFDRVTFKQLAPR